MAGRFSIRYFFSSVALCDSGCINAWDLPVIEIYFPCYLFILTNDYFLSIPIFHSEIILLPLHPVVCMSLCLFLVVVGKIFFYLLKIPVLIALLDSVSISFIFPLLSLVSLDSLLVALSYFSAVLFWYFPSDISLHIFLFLASSLVVLIYLFLSSLISPPGFVFLFAFLWGTPIYE